QRRKVRQSVKRQIDLAGRAAELVPRNVLDELAGQVIGADHLHEGQAWIDARQYGRRDVIVAVLEDDARGFVVFDEDVLDGRIDADLGAERARGGRDRFRDA